VAAEHAEFLAARRASLAALSRPALAARGGALPGH
jgi:hypothetical protein